MKNYLAQYTIKAAMFDGGAWMPDPEPHKREHSFQAQDSEQAKTMAEAHRLVLTKEYFGPMITLDRLVETTEIRL